MQVVRTILWVIVAVVLVLCWVTNDTRVDFTFGPVVINARLGTLVITAFLLGMLPMWLVHRMRSGLLSRRLRRVEERVPAAEIHAPAMSEPSLTPDGR